MDLGMGELIVIFLVVLILFGANKLPALGEGLGKAIRGFKEGMRNEPVAKGDLPAGPGPDERKG